MNSYLLITSQATFKRFERLKHKKLIEKLFDEGKSVTIPPLKVLYLPCSTLSCHQVLFAVPKKRFKRAAVRNKLKRRMREAYRLNKHLLVPDRGLHFVLGYIYIASSALCSFAKIQEKLVISLQRINQLHA